MIMLKKYKKYIVNIIISVLSLLIFGFGLLWFVEYKIQDAIYRDLHTTSHPDIYIFGIDDDTLAKFGPSYQQWNRQIMADAINILNSGEHKPLVIAIDVLYIGESEDKEADKNLAEAVKNGGNVVVASMAVTSEDTTLRNVVKEHIKPYPELAQYASYGAVKTIFDRDSVIRNFTLKMQYDGNTIYSFPYEVYKKYKGGQTNDYAETENEIYIAYRSKPGEYEKYSFADIFFKSYFMPDFLENSVENSIVFIGAYSPDLMDLYYTPTGKEQMYGVEIYANILQMLLEDNIKKYTPQWINFIVLLFLISAGIALAELLDIRVVLGIFIFLSAGYILFAKFVLYDKGYILSIIYPVFTLAVIYVYKLISKYIVDALEKSRIKGAFKKYADPKLVDKLMESREAYSDEVGVKKNIAVLFADVRGFALMTELLRDTPETVVHILNKYLELTTTAVFNNGGNVDKFMGDATMALFNGFVPLEDYVYKAVKAAWDMVKGAIEVNASMKEKYGVDIGFGVGVTCGEAIVGNLGPPFRKDYTAIGDSVNTASRLESLAKRSEILISREVYDIVKDRIESISLGKVPLKGKTLEIEIFSVTELLDN